MDAKKKMHEIQMLQERNIQVGLFMERMLLVFGADVLRHMPTYDAILFDNKELTAANYVDVKFLTNKN
jgi:hypothetical protein